MKEKTTMPNGEKSISQNSKTATMEAILQEKKREVQLDEAFELTNAASYTDCTGSVPVAAVTQEQWDSYNEFSHFKPEAAEPMKKL